MNDDDVVVVVVVVVVVCAGRCQLHDALLQAGQCQEDATRPDPADLPVLWRLQLHRLVPRLVD